MGRAMLCKKGDICIYKKLTRVETLNLTKLTAFSNNKINATQMFSFAFDKIKTLSKKVENAGYHSDFKMSLFVCCKPSRMSRVKACMTV